MDKETFEESVRQVRASPTRGDLAAATQASLKALLRQPADQALLQSLLAQADTITRRLPDTQGEQSREVRQAAVRCVVLLETAQKGRQKKKDHRVLILLVAAAAVGGFYILLLI